MNTLFLGIVVFLIVLAVFDLFVGVSNDAVNFLNSSIGAKVAKFKTIVLVAAIGVFAGAAMSNGMMDVARHGIMTPEYFSFYEVMCVFLAVMVTDVILLDVFNTLGLPTSTTVSMVFELLGGTFALAILKIWDGTKGTDGVLLTLGDLLNTEKAMSVIIGIFLSVAIAFVFGALVMWISRIVFSFTYRVNGTTTDYTGNMGSRTASSLKIGIFGGIAVTSIIWFLLINGLKGSSFMTPEVKDLIKDYTWYIIGGGFVVFSVIMTILSALKVPVLKFIVLLGTFALAMAFAGNDLVNFVGVPLTGLEAYQDYMANGAGDPDNFLMKSLMDSAHTPVLYLVLAGVIMVLSLIFSKKAHNVTKTEVGLGRQDEGDEMFGSSAAARAIVRSSSKCAKVMAEIVPSSMGRWIDSRFNRDEAMLENGAAFDLIRAAVNLVLAGLLVAFGTSMKLPLSTTYVTFMVAMGSSLADRAWSRESAVFRITGVLSVIGGWFITAGVAFIACYLITNAMYFGSFVVMAVAIVLAIFLLVRSNVRYKEPEQEKGDTVFATMVHTKDKDLVFSLLKEHSDYYDDKTLRFVGETYNDLTSAFFEEKYRDLKRTTEGISNPRKILKRQRRREIIGLRHCDQVLALEKNTWYFLQNSSMEQMLYSLKRLVDPCREHVGNNFTPVGKEYIATFNSYRDKIINIYQRTETLLTSKPNLKESEALRSDIEVLQKELSNYSKTIIDSIQRKSVNIETMTVYLNIIQESQSLLSSLRHYIRGKEKFLA